MIQLSPKIEKDIVGDVTTLTHLVVIASDSQSPIYISTQKQMFEGNVWEDLNFRLSGIKEKLDLIKRNFTINNVSFSLNNFININGVRFSDLISKKSLMNQRVDIYYKTISCETLSDCALVYRGSIRSVRHDSTNVNITLEDNTEDKLSKEVPTANIGYRRAAFSPKYHDRPIPILYGKVDKAPAIPIFDEALDENDSYSQNRIHIICDDTRGDREISLGGFFQDEETKHIEQDMNPLYIYKEDYFQVLQDWSDKCTTETDLWGESEQYLLSADEILINKKFHKAEAINPPANNELCCIKKRRPNDLQLLQNPTASDEQELATWEDEQGFGVRFTQETVLSPSSCFDSENSVSQSSFFYSGNFGGVKNSYTQIPNQSIPLQSNWTFLNLDFRPTSDRGIQNQFEGGEGGLTDRINRWQAEVPSWLTRYAHLFNEENEEGAGLVFIKLPSMELIYKTINRRLWEQFETDEGNLGDIYRWHNEQGLSFPDIVGITDLNDGWYQGFSSGYSSHYEGAAQIYGNASGRVNVETNMCGSMLMDWASNHGSSNVDMSHFYNNYDGSIGNGWDYPINFGAGIKWVHDSYIAENGMMHYIDHTYFYYPALTPFGYYPDSPDVPLVSDYIEYSGTFSDKFIYPNLRIQFKSVADTVDTSFTSEVIDTFVYAPINLTTNVQFNILDVLSKKFVTIGSKAGETTTYYSQGGSCYTEPTESTVTAEYYDLFDLEDFEGGGSGNNGGLFDSNDFPQFKPVNLTDKIKTGNNVFPYYAVKWNGITPSESPDYNLNSRLGTDLYYFGGYGRAAAGGVPQDYTPVRENQMLSGQLSSSNNDGWAIWVRNKIEANGNIINIGESVASNTHPDEYNETALQKVEIRSHTLIPMTSNVW